MKSPLLHIILILTFSSNAQTANEIILKTIEKCNAIESGYYEMDFKMKFISGPDTSSRSYNCYFKKLDKDPCFPVQFNYQYFYDNELNQHAVYNSKTLTNGYSRDSSGQTQSVDKWIKEIVSISHNYTFYDPFTSIEKSDLPSKKSLKKEKYKLQLIGQEKINGYNCHHIQINLKKEHLEKAKLNYIKKEFHLWINKKDHYPIKYSTEYILIMENDTMVQYQLYELKKYELNQPINNSLFLATEIPEYYKIKEYKPYHPPPLLPIDTIAPYWKHISLDGDSIGLNDLKGKLVLVDFFYKSCYPCMLALPDLQWLHENYYDKGLRIVGLDPFDNEDDNLKDFLSKRGVTYPIVYSNRDVANLYRVSGYPTLYLIDKDGKIIHHKKGYGKKMKKELKKVIKDYLN